MRQRMLLWVIALLAIGGPAPAVFAADATPVAGRAAVMLDMTNARAITDAGWILGDQIDAVTGQTTSVLISPAGEVTPLPTPDGTRAAFALGINASGVVVGGGIPDDAPRGGFAPSVGVIWAGDQITLLEPLPGDNFVVARDINDQGQIVGGSFERGPPGGPTHGMLWEGDTLTVLEPPEGMTFAELYDINNVGQIVGYRFQNGMFRPVLWQDGVPIELPMLPGDQAGAAIAINDAGQIIGWTGRAECPGPAGGCRAVLWEAGVVRELAAPEGFKALTLAAINERGQIAVTLEPNDGPWQAGIWDAGEATLLPRVDESLMESASDINAAGDVVGAAEGGYAILWRSADVVPSAATPVA